MNIARVAPLALLAASCAGMVGQTPSRVGGPVKISYELRDSPDEKRLYLTFINDKPKPICMGAENWPSNGILLNDGNRVFLSVAGQKFSLNPEQDYCPNCTIKVKPSMKSVAFLKYESFNLPDQLSSAKKELVFEPVGYRCR